MSTARHLRTKAPASRWRIRTAVCATWLCAAVLAGCTGGTRPTVKIGLVAPFEGRFRDVGYEVIYAVRLAVREANAAGGVAGYSVELVALDDGGEVAQAVEQAEKIATDPAVVVVIGHWLAPTTEAAAAAYRAAGIPHLITADLSGTTAGVQLFPTPADLRSAAADFATRRLGTDWTYCDCGLLGVRERLVSLEPATVFGPPIWGLTQFWSLNEADGAYFVAAAPRPADVAGGQDFARRYLQISNGVQPGSLAVLAYDAASVALDALAADISANRAPSRSGIVPALQATRRQGLSGWIEFDSGGQWRTPATTVYRWQGGQIVNP